MNDLIGAWLTARSVARGLPLPVPDRGGYRVDTNTEDEVCRWVFPRMAAGVRDLAHEITSPLHALKLCGEPGELRAVVPSRWEVEVAKYVMVAGATLPRPSGLPDGYQVERRSRGLVTHVVVRAKDGLVAASGYAAEMTGVFVYDRIVTAPLHRRRGLGRAVMSALGEALLSASSRPVLVATREGRDLYLSLGWTVCSPYATALIPGPNCRRFADLDMSARDAETGDLPRGI